MPPRVLSLWFFTAFLLVSVLQTQTAMHTAPQTHSHTHTHTHTHGYVDAACLCREMPPCKMKHTHTHSPAVCVCVCFSFSPSFSEATFCPFKAVSDWPLSPSLPLCLSTCLSLSLPFHYMPPLSPLISPLQSLSPSFCSFLFPFCLSCSKNPSI